MEILSITNVLSSPRERLGNIIQTEKKKPTRAQSQHKNNPSPLAGPIADNKVPICCSVNELEERKVQESRLKNQMEGEGEWISLWSDCDHLLQLEIGAGKGARSCRSRKEPGTAPGRNLEFKVDKGTKGITGSQPATLSKSCSLSPELIYYNLLILIFNR